MSVHDDLKGINYKFAALWFGVPIVILGTTFLLILLFGGS